MRRILLTLALALIAPPASAQTEAIIGKTTTITVGWPGCRSDAVFDRLNSLASSGDITAFLKFSFDNRATGECMVFPIGLKVRIEKISEQHVCVRPEGRESIAHFKRQAADMAKRVAQLEADANDRPHGKAMGHEATCFWVEADHVANDK